MPFFSDSLKAKFYSNTASRRRKPRLSFGSLSTVFIWLILSGSLVMADSSDDFCTAIKEIIHNGRVDFKPIHGKLDLVSEEYFGKLTPSGLEDCFGWLDGQAYHCRTPSGLDSETVTKVYDTYKKVIRHCLPERWETSERNAGRTNARRFMTYASEDHFVELRIGERSQRKGWYVDFYFRR